MSGSGEWARRVAMDAVHAVDGQARVDGAAGAPGAVRGPDGSLWADTDAEPGAAVFGCCALLARRIEELERELGSLRGGAAGGAGWEWLDLAEREAKR